MRNRRHALGSEGEARAAAFLARRGYRIVERNVRAAGAEIDLIAARGRVLIFVEVKTRRARRHGPPEESVDARKQARLVRAAGAWLHAKRPRVRRVRFDVVTCEPLENGEWRIRHLEGAFDANP